MSTNESIGLEPIADPDPSHLLELIAAFRKSKTLFVAVSLGIFDALESQSKTLDSLSRELSCSSDGLERLLDACAGLGLLEKIAGNYSNTNATNVYLTKNSQRRLTGYIGYSNSVMWKLWAYLENAVREGSHRWPQAYGWDGPIFSHFFNTEEAKREFLMGMHGYGVISSPHVVSAFDLSRFSHLVDLGGATGHLASAACELYSNMQATVFDLPEAIPLAREILDQTRVAHRVATLAGDFFTDPLPAADLYAVGRILHDWSQEKCQRLLTRMYEALPQGGAVLIAEKMLSDDKSGPCWAQLQSLNMLTCTEGKERSLPEYTELLRECGFRNIEGRITRAPLDAILAVK